MFTIYFILNIKDHYALSTDLEDAYTQKSL